MPAKSQAQRAWVYKNKGAAWAKEHGFDNKGKLPARVKGKKVKSKKSEAAEERKEKAKGRTKARKKAKVRTKARKKVKRKKTGY